MATIRLTTSQAIIKFLKNQYVQRDGQEMQFFAGVLGIFRGYSGKSEGSRRTEGARAIACGCLVGSGGRAD